MGLTRYSVLSLIVFLPVIIAIQPALAGEFPGASGMARLDGKHMLIVQDVKRGQPGANLGVLTVLEDGGYEYLPIKVDWPERQANDLESCAAVPGRPGEFLVAESGAYYEQWDDPTSKLHQGRIFYIHVQLNGDKWDVEVINTMPIPLAFREVEGMFCIHTQDLAQSPVLYDMQMQADARALASDSPNLLDRVIGLVTRGGDTPYESAMLYYGKCNLGAGKLEFTDQGRLGEPLNTRYRTTWPWCRGCSDIYVDDAGTLWIAVAQDMGDSGPFSSAIYCYGKFTLMGQYYGSSYYYPPELIWTVEGLKIEAIGPGMIEGAVMSYATDDEGYGGIWRVVGPPTQRQW